MFWDNRLGIRHIEISCKNIDLFSLSRFSAKIFVISGFQEMYLQVKRTLVQPTLPGFPGNLVLF